MMFPMLCVLIVMIAMVWHSGFAQLELNPAELRLTNGASTGFVNISCGIPSGVTASSVYVITVSRYLKSQPATEQRLARADLAVNQGQAALAADSGVNQNTTTVSGSTSQKSLTLTLTQAKCEDASTYVCKISYNADTGGSSKIENIDAHDNFTVVVPPANIAITADPQSEEGNYLVGTSLSLTCNGIPDTAVGKTWQWSWQYQDHLSTSWTPYPNGNYISEGPILNGKSSCQSHQMSRLTLYLTLEDSQRTYKCVIQANNNQDLASAQYTLGIVDTELPAATSTVDPALTNTTTKTSESNFATGTIPDHSVLCFVTFVSITVLMETGA